MNSLRDVRRVFEHKQANAPMFHRTSATADGLDLNLKMLGRLLMFSDDRILPTEPQRIPTHQLDNASDRTTGLIPHKMNPTTNNNQPLEVKTLNITTTGLELRAIDCLANSITASMKQTKRSVVEPSIFIGDILEFADGRKHLCGVVGRVP